MHPLTPNLTELKDEDLRKKFMELQSRLMQAYSFGKGQLVQQIQMLMEDYQAELNRRQQKQLDELLQQNKKFDEIIDVKK